MAHSLVSRGLLQKGFCAALLLTLALPAVAQGPPDIEWQGSHAGHASAIAFSPDGALVASGADDHTTKLWRAADGALLRALVQCTGVGCRGPGAVAFSPDGTLLATAGNGLKLWSVADGSLVRTISVGAASIAFSPDGEALVESGSGSSYNSRFVRLVRVADGAVLWSVTAGGGGVAFSGDGSMIAAVGRGGVDLLQANGAPIWHLDGARSAVAFSPDDAVVAVSGNGLGAYRYDETISLLRTSDGSTKRTLTRTGAVTSLAFSSDGAHLVAGGWDPNESFVSGSSSTRRGRSASGASPRRSPSPTCLRG
jgi:WD40 repeat protein